MESTLKGNNEIMAYLNLIGLTMYAGYISSKNMEDTFNKNIKLYYTPVRLVATCTKHTRSRIWKPLLKEIIKTIVYPSCIGYYIY